MYVLCACILSMLIENIVYSTAIETAMTCNDVGKLSDLLLGARIGPRRSYMQV